MKAVLLLLSLLFAISPTKIDAFYSEGCVVYLENNIGKLRFTTVVDGVVREYFVHVPLSYTGDVAVPMVFMLHGTSGDGEKFYDSKGWKEVADDENFIAVFPSSMRYKIFDLAEGNKTTTKWNTTPDANWEFQPGEKGQDDIKFLRKVILEMKGKFNIDATRIYLNGFSNGGQMAAKCSIEMSDVLAAVAENAGSFYLDTTYIPKRNLPVLFQVGNRDYGPGNTGPSIPMSYLDTIISTDSLSYLGGKHFNIAKSHINNFDLLPDYVITGDSNVALIATFQPRTPGPGTGYEFHFILVKDMGHIYPNGSNHILDAPRIHWEWMKKYRLEQASDSTNYYLNVESGYGSGYYEKGDVVHIWASEKEGMVFSFWSGDTEHLGSPNEYHTTVTTPDKNIKVEANYDVLVPDMTFETLTLNGAERNKKVYTYFPAKEKIKGVVWLFHGTNGNALAWVNEIENRQWCHRLMASDYGIVAITSEESEFETDLNNDGYYRWSYGIDSNLIDMANIRVIRDALITSGKFKGNTPQIAMGFSAGGAFAEFVALVFNWRAAVNHNTSGSTLLSEYNTIPYFHCISENDNHPDVGAVGNQEALDNYLNYINRDACVTFEIFKQMPLYAQRFDRSPLISESLSEAIFNEIKSNNGLDDDHYLKGLYADLEEVVLNNPTNFPVLMSLTFPQRNHVKDQIQTTNAEHHFKSDFNGRTMAFIQSICTTTNSEDYHGLGSQKILISPNPAFDVITVHNTRPYSIYSLTGILMDVCTDSVHDISEYLPGIYFVKTEKGFARFIKI